MIKIISVLTILFVTTVLFGQKFIDGGKYDFPNQNIQCLSESHRIGIKSVIKSNIKKLEDK